MTAQRINPVFLAVDTVEMDDARALAAAAAPAIGGLKLGLEFFNRHGLGGVAAVIGDLPLFLDLKLHDIPNTVAGAVRGVAAARPSFLTIHASGGGAMIRAARAAADPATRILAVTVLTSLDEVDLRSVGQSTPLSDQVKRLAALAQESGADGAVCSPWEVAALRAQCGPDFILVVPGIRPLGSALGDQKRVMGPAAAIAAGASHLVIGRPISAAPDPRAAALAIAQELGLAESVT
jgi:orotidine-5'-phosphate decarboxylase